MKIYALVGSGKYGGGMAVIAASNEDEARSIGGTINDRIWNTNYAKPNSIFELPATPNELVVSACVLTHYETGE